MHMPKFLLPVSAITLSLLAGSAIAKDTESDAQLREALRQKVSEMTNQPVAPAAQAPAPAATVPTPTPSPARPATVTTTPPAARPLAASPAVTAPDTSATPAWVDDPETAKLREALRQRLEQEAVSPTPPTPIVVATPPPSVPSAKTTPAKTTPAKTTPAKATPAKATPAKTTPAKTTPAKATSAGGQPAGYAPPVPPPLPISGSKQERLQELLNQYKADLLTPAEYHAQRAKIIAE